MKDNGSLSTSPIETLHALEAVAIESAEKMADAATEFAWALYQIVENNLWKYHVDDEGNPVFERLTDYLRYLDQQCLRSRSAMWADIKALRFANAYGYSSHEKVAEHGLSIFKKITEKADIDRRTYKIKGRSDEEVRAVIEELSQKPSRFNAGLTPADVHEQIEHRFQISGSVWIQENSDGTMSWFRRVFEDGYPRLQVGEVRIELTDDPPKEVEEFVRKKLRGR